MVNVLPKLFRLQWETAGCEPKGVTTVCGKAVATRLPTGW